MYIAHELSEIYVSKLTIMTKTKMPYSVKNTHNMYYEFFYLIRDITANL